MEPRGATSAQHRRPAVARRLKSECTGQRSCLRVRLRNDRLRSQSSRKYLRRPKLGDVQAREGDLFISYARTMPIHLAVPKHEPAANDGRDAMASTRAIGAWINSSIPSYAR